MRLLVVKYTGAHIADTSDAVEKQTIDELWEQKSSGKGLLLVAENMVDGRDVRRQFIDKAILA
ncbi:MAG: restriction endonuclease subunit R [Acidobacteria bacterium]|nr:restriction endonuclease subunit R [Acidobacteriota bacterium]MYC80845.1 restriction endonuclease subunit R [Acidobacteriota bacterium]